MAAGKQRKELTEREAIEQGYFFALTTAENAKEPVWGRNGRVDFLDWCHDFVALWRERNENPNNDAAVVKLNENGKYVIATKETPYVESRESKPPFISEAAAEVWRATRKEKKADEE